jgi:tetrahydromethanopterin S-methyltransferase subunit C
MSVKIEASEGGMPHNTLMAIGLIGSVVGIYLTYLNVLTGTEVFSFFGGIGAVCALVWGSDTIKHLCSYGIGTGVPSAGMMAFGSGVIGMLLATKFGLAAPIAAVIIAGIIGAVLGYLANNVVNMNIPVMIQSLIEMAVIGAMTLLGFAAMAGGSFVFDGMLIGTTSFLGFEIETYALSVLGGGIIAVLFMLGGIALQHPFNACLGPNESQDRTLMLAAECGFLSMIAVAVISFAFIGFLAAVVSLIVSIIGWGYTYRAYIELSKRDAFDWLDAKPIREVGGEQ